MTATPKDVIGDFHGKLATGDAPGAVDLMVSDIYWATIWHDKVEGSSPGPVALLGR